MDNIISADYFIVDFEDKNMLKLILQCIRSTQEQSSDTGDFQRKIEQGFPHADSFYVLGRILG